MAPRRTASNTLSPPATTTPSPSSPASLLSQPRSTSPSGGFTQFITKPTKWFRSNSSGAGRTSISSSEPRSSTSSGRKHKISHPTDPRPIMDTLVPPKGAGLGMHSASRSVADLSLARTNTAMTDSRPINNRTPSSPSPPSFDGYSMGDLRNLSRKPWSKSADDLGKMSPSASTPALTPIDTTLHNKIRTYRSDSIGSSVAATPSPAPSPSTASFNMNYPFPAIAADVSTSPPKATNARLGPPLVSASSITPPLTPASTTSSYHVHSRSHSFTPRLPSKLSSAGLLPPSPKRKGSTSSESRDVESNKGSSGSGPAARSPFPFGFSGGKPAPLYFVDGHVSQGPSSPTLLAPPTIVEPEDGVGDGTNNSGKRSSQMVHQSGFINRMADFSPSMLSSRAHHAYVSGGSQAVLAKGWKPFKLVLKGSKLYFYKPPSDRGTGIRELFPTELVAVLEDEAGSELSVDVQDSEMDMGSRGGKSKEREDMRRRRAYWGRGFSATILLLLPMLVGNGAFETEFQRICSNLINGASDEAQPEEQRRVQWLAAKYLDYHGAPASQEAWDAWVKDTIPKFSSTDELAVSSSSATTQPSPRMQSIIEAMQETSQRPTTISPDGLRTALEEEGLSRDVLLNLDPSVVARSLLVCQKTSLTEVPDLGTLTVNYLIAGTPPESAISPSPGSALAPFLGSDERPHWLTRLVLIQVLVPEPAGAQNPRPHSRSEVIAGWARVAEAARRGGDECAWRAIMAALCSRAIARLDKVWKRIDPETLVVVQRWAQILVRGDQPTQTVPLACPWIGDAEQSVRDALDKARCGEEWLVNPMRDAREKFDAFRGNLALCRRRRIEQFMSLSLAAEPRRKGLYEPYFWSRASMPPTTHPLAALLFPEPLPAVSVINRAQLLRGRMDSNASASLNIQDIHDLRLQPDGERASRMDKPKLVGFDLGGTLIPVYGGELMLLVQPGGDTMTSSRPASRAPSRPPSRTTGGGTMDSPIAEKMFNRNPSIRVTPGSSHGHGAERKSSLARRNSCHKLRRPLRVVVQAGTLDRLVDVLVHGLQGVSVSVADDNGEIPLTDKKTREVKVDMDDFSQVWWNVFRCFVSPQVLFELMRKRYIGAYQPGRALTGDEVSHIVRLRLEVLDTMSEWITQGGGAQDSLDDGALYESFITFFSQPTEQKMLESVSEPESDASQALRTLEINAAGPEKHAYTESANDGMAAGNYSSELPDIDQLEPEELVNNLNLMASATFRNVTQEDFFATADLLELQSADRTGCSIADEVEIQSMNSYILEIEPSPLISELAQENLYRLLPPTVRSCIRAFGIIRKWLISKIAASRLGFQGRAQRMERVLRAIERPCVRSFVESALTSAVLSVESRTYQRAWLGVAVGRGTGCDSLASYLARPVVTHLSSRGTLTVDIGWLMEKVLEIISLPDVLESPSEERAVLVNFEKRRSLQTLLANASGVTSSKRHRRREADRREFERLNNMERELSSHAVRHPTKKGVHRPFQLIVAVQQEKNRRDKVSRDRLSKEKRAEQQRMNQRRPNPVMPKAHRNKKSMSSAFFQLMRPISSAFTSDTLSAPRTPAELDFVPSSKPSLVLSVAGVRVAQFINNERSFVFQIDSEDGGHYLLQAASQQDMKKWIDTIERVSKTTANRRLTYLGPARPQMDDLISRPAGATRDPVAVFGVDLDFLLKREAPDGEVQPGAVPIFLGRLIAEVERRGLTEVGIYRIAGAHSEVNSLRDALNRGEWPISEITDIHAVCDLIKSWFRVLPGGLFPADTYGQILAAAGGDTVDLEARVTSVRDMFHSIFEEEGEHEMEHDGEYDEDLDAEFEEPIPEEDEEDEDLFANDRLPHKLPPEPPQLSVNLGSPAELSFSIP
ncbi:uncharacterized protein BXZ73DRAFT_89498 [Epithele typhae]|uniref:uncharacterized protein n=1 Tax=Epithele typhae TaxID=378194 RepID=UPI002007E14F|nr:uncharacterized protein BXZ73DRAFT_89498 [Epithele typhae]KAH9935113.1 hypothetical protein BXZ73DRAFT_89498 [Epithele typhae]